MTTPITTRFARLGGLLEALLDLGGQGLLLVLRGYWGYQFYITGWGKLQNLDRVATFFGSLGLPFPRLNAMLAGSAECFGGLLLLAGLGARPAALVLSTTMGVAYVTADRDALVGLFRNPEPFIKADPFLFLMVSLLVLFLGPGLVSLDAFALWLLGRRAGATPGWTGLWVGRSAARWITRDATQV